jgi:CRISPR/Cas system CMR-associated protein Cmr5 small subunit
MSLNNFFPFILILTIFFYRSRNELIDDSEKLNDELKALLASLSCEKSIKNTISNIEKKIKGNLNINIVSLNCTLFFSNRID